MAGTRPTAVNLFWAIERMRRTFAAAALAGESVDQIKDRLDAESAAIHDEDVASCRALGAFGADVVPTEARILTHCNAGALATAGYGTALGVVRGAVDAGKHVVVFADETRPFLQGARLTAWELVRDGIQTTVITDNMAAALMLQGKVDLVVVGADRIAANGDTANKIGTYGVAVLAREHNIPFYVAAPLSTIDLDTADGAGIPIEERSAREVTHIGGSQMSPAEALVWNPAFDVTPHRFITGIITERGIFRPPYTESLKRAFEERERVAASP
jgi:methylthioribose-1-phosphate isomerase